MELDKNEICTHFKGGDLDKLYSRFYSPLFFFAKKCLGSCEPFLAEDIVQNSILAAWKIRNKFENDNALKSFLYTAVKNSTISVVRKNLSKRHYISYLEKENPFLNMIEEETFIKLMDAVNELPENYRTIFNRIYLDKASIKDVATEMELSEISIKKYKAKGLIMLRDKLKSDDILSIFFFL